MRTRFEFGLQQLASRRNPFLALVAASTLVISFLYPANAENLDFGYPQGIPAPGRTCPNTDEGIKIVSEYNGKILVCTMINGAKKWWIEGDPLPTSNSSEKSGNDSSQSQIGGVSPQTTPVNEYTPTYKLSAGALTKIKVFENVKYSTLSPAQRLDIYMPKGVSKPPLLVWIHGGGFVFGDEDSMKYDDSAKLLEVLAKNGIAVASVNYRLAQEGMFPAAGKDVKMAIRFLRANANTFGFDSKKFATGGDSAGAYLALMAAITGDQASIFDDQADPNRKISARISTVLDLFGNVDFLEMSSNKAKFPCDQSKNPFPGPEGNVHPWFGDMTNLDVQSSMKSAGLYPYLKKSKSVPTFFIFHGLDDCSVSPHDSINLDKAVKLLKGKSALALIPGEIHGGSGVWAAVMKAVPAFKKTVR